MLQRTLYLEIMTSLRSQLEIYTSQEKQLAEHTLQRSMEPTYPAYVLLLRLSNRYMA